MMFVRGSGSLGMIQLVSKTTVEVGGPAQFLEKFKNQPKITKLGIIVELAV